MQSQTPLPQFGTLRRTTEATQLLEGLPKVSIKAAVSSVSPSAKPALLPFSESFPSNFPHAPLDLTDHFHGTQSETGGDNIQVIYKPE